MTVEAVTVGALATLLAPIYIMVFQMNRRLGQVCRSVEVNDDRLDDLGGD